MKKRGISILLALLLIVSLLPGAAFAQDRDTVRVIVENKTYLEPLDDEDVAPAWTGTLLDETVALTDDMTMMDAVVAALESKDVSQTGAESGYITEINGLSASDTMMGGWMGTLNDWFTDTMFNDTPVEAGDVICLQYTSEWGTDIGSLWYNRSQEDLQLTNLTFNAGALEPAFSSAATEYTLTVPADTQMLTVTPTAVNKNNKVTVLSADETEARWGARTVRVADGNTLTVRTAGLIDNAPAEQTYTIHIRTAAPAHACASYTDLTDDWSRAGICYVIDNGIMVGTDTNVFSPDVATTRAMLVTVLWRMAGCPSAATAATFTDIQSGRFYTNAVAWAEITGIVSGYPDGTFAPMQAITREEAAAVLYRYAKVFKMDTTASNDLSAFADCDTVHRYARTAMQWAVGSGLISGMSQTELAPQGTAKRAQVAAILWRMLESGTPLQSTARDLLTAVPAPVYGDEWVVLDMARSNVAATPGYQNYYSQLEAKVKETGGVLSDRYYTEYARVVLAVTAIGKDATDVADYDLVAPLTDVDKVASQGINGVIYALIALDSGSYAADVRAQYVDAILEAQLADGGFTYSSEYPTDPDLTAMALQALAPYCTEDDVAKAVDRALTCLSAMQQSDGGFVSWGASSAESSAQAIIALCTLGIDLEDSRFVKDGNSLLDHLLTFQLADGGFCHTADGAYNAMATEQAMRALVAVQRAEAGESALYQVR